MFAEPLHGQPYTENGLNGHISDFRWHVADNIPFQTSFEGAIENKFEENAQSPDTVITLGQVELPAGDHVFTIALAGKNPKAEPGWRAHFYCYFDYIKLQPAK